MHFDRMLRAAICVAAFSMPTLISAVLPANAQAPADWASITAAAKQEGKLTVYGAGVVLKAVIEKFQAKTGIATQLLEGRTTEVRRTHPNRTKPPAASMPTSPATAPSPPPT